ncbi:hypothetical protein C8R42DRAFT_673046 [Lentinula raphanica]|nr:hypothetical protein C8R42DRAFT_673046 [Lentinula raphanica]
MFRVNILYQLFHLGLAECRNGKKLVVEILHPLHEIGMNYLSLQVLGFDELKDFVVGLVNELLPFCRFAVDYLPVRGAVQPQHFGEESVRPFDVAREIHTRHLLVLLRCLQMIHTFHFTPSDPQHLVKVQQVGLTRVPRLVEHAIYRIHKLRLRPSCHLYSSQDRVINRGIKNNFVAAVNIDDSPPWASLPYVCSMDLFQMSAKGQSRPT